MAANVLTGRIQITAPGALKVFDQIGARLTKLQTQVLAFGGGVQKFNSSFSKLATPVAQVNKGLASVSQSTSSAAQSFSLLGNATVPLSAGMGKVAKASTGVFGGLRSIANVIPGIGAIGLISVLSGLASGLFKTADAFSKAELDAIKFKTALEDIKTASDNLRSFLDLQNTLADLDFRIAGGEGAAADINKFKGEISSNNQVIKDYEKTINALNPRLVQMNEQLDGFKSGAKNIRDLNAGFKQTAAAQLALSGVDLNKITGDQLKKLSATQREFVTEYQQLTKSVNDADKGRADALDKNRILQRQIQLTGVEEQKRIFEKAKGDYEKYVNGIISRGKQLAAYFKDVAFVPTFTIFDTLSQEFQKAQAIIDQFGRGALKLKLPPVGLSIEAPEKGVGGLEFGEMFSKELNDYFKGPFTTDFSLLEAMKPVVLTDMEKLAISISESLSNLAADSLSSIAEGIGDALGSGDLQNAFQGFARVIGQGFIAIGKQMVAAAPIIAALKAALQTLNPAVLLPAGLALIAIGAALNAAVGRGIGRRARGGPVSGGMSYLVGEEGPELFRPNTGGTIVPNNALGGGSFTQGGVIVQVTGQFGLRGQDLLATIALANQSKNRLQ